MPRKALRWVKAAGLPDVLQGKAAPACIKMQHSNFSVSTKVRAGQRLGGTVSRSVTFGCFSSWLVAKWHYANMFWQNINVWLNPLGKRGPVTGLMKRLAQWHIGIWATKSRLHMATTAASDKEPNRSTPAQKSRLKTEKIWSSGQCWRPSPWEPVQFLFYFLSMFCQVFHSEFISKYFWIISHFFCLNVIIFATYFSWSEKSCENPAKTY